MTRDDTKQILETGYIKPNGNDWYDMVIGTILGLGIYGSVGVLLIMKFGQSLILSCAYIVFLLSLILYLYWRDTQVKIIKTGLTKKENLDLLKKVFKRLGL